MKSAIFLVVALLIVCCGCDNNTKRQRPGALSERSLVLNVPLIAQKTEQWCWAASAEMILNYHGYPNEHTQCVQANYKFENNNCCNNPTPTDCIHPGWPEFEKFGYDYYTTEWGNALSWEDLKKEIDSNRPFVFAWGWKNSPSSMGHMMTLVGYSENENIRMVYINDPWLPSAPHITYEEFVSSNRYEHWVDYYEIQYKNTNP